MKKECSGKACWEGSIVDSEKQMYMWVIEKHYNENVIVKFQLICL
jgi:hypothetical protein